MSRHQLKPQPTAAERMERKRQAKEQPSKDYYLASKAKSLSYDYAQIAEADRELVQRAALDIRARLKRTVEDMIEIGRLLNEVQAILPSRQFYDWAQDEFGMSRGSVFEFSQIALRFGEFRSNFERILPSIVRRLAAPSVPDEAVRLVIEAAASRDKALPFKDAMAIVRPFLPAKQPKPKQLPGPPVLPTGQAALTGPIAEPDDAIDAEYTVIEHMVSKLADPDTSPVELSDLFKAATIAQVMEAMSYAPDARKTILGYHLRDLKKKAGSDSDPNVTLSRFDEWLAAMPAELSLRDSLRIFELAKRLANEVRSKHEPLKGKVHNVMMVWSSLITAVEQELKNDGE